jgi:hypothetical protein
MCYHYRRQPELVSSHIVSFEHTYKLVLRDDAQRLELRCEHHVLKGQISSRILLHHVDLLKLRYFNL